ncbi:hypothetical protein [Desulforamulus ruminis]|uniref:Pilus assembly protein, PilO n=1 Tax=Desulforamulus ruminis (strain ATCC 23193 / DSM 2154 / NCIMB 8452 / DL) TaxID=696281 RepID=F6DRJ5_DESRL|nr:hypothetical protein [Desulforamulus ruminis]AEG58749.1 hypothetical protein Desru_0463 [Desulforamulus ruminis DSM 2154]
MKRKLTKAEKFLLLTVLLVGGFYLYLNKVYDPKASAYEQTRTEIIKLQQEIQDFGEPAGTQKIAAKVNESKKQNQWLKAELNDELTKKKALNIREVTLVLDQLSSLAVASGLSIQVVAVKDFDLWEESFSRFKDFQKVKADSLLEEKKADNQNKDKQKNTKQNSKVPEGSTEAKGETTEDPSDPSTYFPWKEYNVILSGDLNYIARYFGAMKEMSHCVLIKKIEVLQNEKTGRLELFLNVLI